MHTDEEG